MNDYPLNEGKSDVLLICCGEYSFQTAFHAFVREELLVERYEIFAIPGSVQILTFMDGIPRVVRPLVKKYLALFDEVIKEREFTRVVIIMHEGCMWYERVLPQLGHKINVNIKEQQCLDMVTAKNVFQKSVPTMTVDMYYASCTKEKRVVFSLIREKKT